MMTAKKDRSVADVFKASVSTPNGRKKKRPPPLSLRLNAKERAELERAAAGMPLGSYIKDKVFDGNMVPRRTRGHQPVKDHAALAQVLGMLGSMRLASNLNQLAKSANMGTLPLTPETEEQLINACATVLAIRMELMRALGYATEDAE